MDEEGPARGGVLNILIGGKPSESSESSELFRCLGLDLGGMGGTGYSGIGHFILERLFAESVLLCLSAS